MRLSRRNLRRRLRQPARKSTNRLNVEPLEARSLLAAGGLSLPVLELLNNDTLDRAQSLGGLSPAVQVRVLGAVDAEQAAAADVDWYSFTLARPSAVALGVAGVPAFSSSFTLGLYNSEPLDFQDRN